MLSASGLMAIVTYMTVQLLQLQNEDMSFLATFPKFGIIVFVSFVAYVWISTLLKLDEPKPVVSKVRSIVFGKRI
jgi:hypothetical protein